MGSVGLIQAVKRLVPNCPNCLQGFGPDVGIPGNKQQCTENSVDLRWYVDMTKTSYVQFMQLIELCTNIMTHKKP